MPLDVKKQCAVCAWRAACAKKHTIGESSLHCPDFSRDLALGPEEAPETAGERHKRVEDIFGDSKD